MKKLIQHLKLFRSYGFNLKESFKLYFKARRMKRNLTVEIQEGKFKDVLIFMSELKSVNFKVNSFAEQQKKSELNQKKKSSVDLLNPFLY